MDTKTNVRNQSVELGKVTWLRDYNTALKLSKLQEKPVLLQSQE